MRLWSLHPSHLDAKGLVALWREALLAQAVLAGKTKGYKKHPQLQRFREQEEPLKAIGAYLCEVREEGERRGYKFEGSKILFPSARCARVPVTIGQLEFEWKHLKSKLSIRDRNKLKENERSEISAHPIFRKRKGKKESWEKNLTTRRQA